MIQKLRWKFILLSVLSLACVLLVSMGMLVTVDFVQAHHETNRVLSSLVNNNGHLTPKNGQAIFGDPNNPFERNFSTGQGNPETVYQYRYFSLIVAPKGQFRVVNNGFILGLKKNKVAGLVKTILYQSGVSQGIIRLDHNLYRFQVKNDPHVKGGKIIIFLNTSLIYAHSWFLLRIAIVLSIFALIFFTLILAFFSKKAIQPIANAYHKQRQFITNAGHELKTPLTVIQANTEMQEMLGQESEWTKSTKEQTKRLTHLINQLIAMARLGETGDLVLSRVDFSKVVTKMAQSFTSVMKHAQLHYQIEVQSGLHVMAENQSLGEIVNILLDNAHKYCDPKEIVRVVLRRGKLGKNAYLVVTNSYRKGQNVDYQNFFERFYRADRSHTEQDHKAGFGIGLSMARDLVAAFKGKISVNYKNGMISFVVVLKLVK